jgi:hypothetical protein
MDDKNKVETLKSIEHDKYLNVDLDHLIMFTIGKLNEMNVDLSFENTVVAAYKLFPEKFSLNGYEKYPDSNRIRNSLNRCTMNRKWLGGKALHGFVITEKSRTIIQEAEKRIFGSTIKKKKATSQTRRKELIISEIEKSSTFHKYQNNGINKINEADFCFLLQGTLDTSRTILYNNLKILKLYSKELNRMEIYNFLYEMENKFSEFLEINKLEAQ